MTEPDIGDLAAYQGKDPQQALDAALAVVQAYCGWSISPSVSATSNVWSTDGYVVTVPTLNMTAVTSVTQDGSLVGPTTYTWESYGVIRCNPGSYFNLLTRVTVVYTHGYAALPADVKIVVLSLAQRSISDTRGMVPHAGAGHGIVITENYGPQLSAGDKANLAPYVVSAGFA